MKNRLIIRLAKLICLLFKNIIFLWEVSCVRAFELHAKTLESPWMHVKSNRGSFMNEHLKNLRWDKFVKMYMLIDRHLHLHFFFQDLISTSIKSFSSFQRSYAVLKNVLNSREEKR